MARRDRMAVGARDRIVRIEQRPVTDAVDDEGAPTDGPWTTLVEYMPAAKTDLIGNERVRADQVTARSDQRWDINYRPDMDPDLVDVPKLRRLVVNERVLEIVSVTEIGRRAGISLYTIAKVG